MQTDFKVGVSINRNRVSIFLLLGVLVFCSIPMQADTVYGVQLSTIEGSYVVGDSWNQAQTEWSIPTQENRRLSS